MVAGRASASTGLLAKASRESKEMERERKRERERREEGSERGNRTGWQRNTRSVVDTGIHTLKYVEGVDVGV